MMQCNKTGLTNKDWRTILDVLNVYDPNDIIDHIPEMGSPEFMQDVTNAFKKVLNHISSDSYKKSYLLTNQPQDTLPVHRKSMNQNNHDMVNEQYIHSLS